MTTLEELANVIVVNGVASCETPATSDVQPRKHFIAMKQELRDKRTRLNDKVDEINLVIDRLTEIIDLINAG